MSKIFEYNGEDHSEFLRYNKDKLKSMYVSYYHMEKYPGYKNNNIIDKTIGYGIWDIKSKTLSLSIFLNIIKNKLIKEDMTQKYI